MKFRSALRSLTITILIAVSSRPAQAQFGVGGVVYDPKNFAQAVLLYKRAYDQLVVARNQLTAQTTALRKLNNPAWRNLSALVTQIDAVVGQGASIGYSIRSVDAEFAHTFPGAVQYGGYQAQQSLATMQATRTLATMRGVLDAVNQTAQAFSAGLTRLGVMKQQMTGVTGHEGAIELANTINAYTAEELTLLRQQVAALTNAQTVYYAHDVTTRAQQQANEQSVWSWFTTPVQSEATISFQPNAQ